MLHFDECKKFKGTIVATDRAAKAIMNGGVIPNYIVTAEAAAHLSQLDYFNVNETKKYPIEVIISERTRHELTEQFHKNKIPYRCWRYPNDNYLIPNVGLMSLVFAKEDLKADKIIMIGMEHEGTEYSEFTFRMWTDRFWWFVRMWGDDVVVNCSEGGKLYGKSKGIQVQESTLKEWI